LAGGTRDSDHGMYSAWGVILLRRQGWELVLARAEGGYHSSWCEGPHMGI